MPEGLTTEQRAEKIAKLLRKAESTTPAEAELLFGKAQELMMKWAIDEAIVLAAQGKNAQVKEEILQKSVSLKGIYSKAEMQIVFTIARANDCKCVYTDWHPGISVTVTGFESDVDRTLLLFSSCNLQAARAMRAWWKDQPDDYYTKKHGYKMRREFIYGFASGLGSKLAEANRAAKAESVAEEAARSGQTIEETEQSVSLVLRSRKDQVGDWYDNHYGNSLRSVRSSRASGGHGSHSAGQAAGRSANLSTGRGVGNPVRGSIGA